MKKKFIAVFISLFLFGFLQARDLINEKVLKSFNETFKEAKNVEWFLTDEKYIVEFVKDDIRYNVTYDKEGNFIRSRRYYFEDKLPMYILFKVKKKYNDKQIYGVTEIMEGSDVYYHIVLEGKNTWWVVKVTSQEFMEITQRLRKP